MKKLLGEHARYEKPFKKIMTVKICSSNHIYKRSKFAQIS